MSRLAVSIGCPCGVGPEVSLLGALAVPGTLLVGDVAVVKAAASVRGIAATRVVRVLSPRFGDGDTVFVWQPTETLAASDRVPGQPGRTAGAAQLAWIDTAMDLVRDGRADALVTGPVSKDAIARSGARGAKKFRGHTEHLAQRLGAPEVTMAFWTPRLTTSLVTTHLALRDVPDAITKVEVARATYWTARFVRQLGASGPIAVAALNPHAGEDGLLGDEEIRALGPALPLARKRLAKEGIDVTITGPVPAETAFRLAASGHFAAVVAMYHDQATIPMKLLGFGEAVNVSLGLPIIRTSVDHGTAYDRAGKGTADARGMIEALGLAVRLGVRLGVSGAS